MNSISFGLIDAFLVLSIIIFILSSHGFVESLLDLIGVVFSLFMAYKLYPKLAAVLLQDGSLPVGIANASSFFIGWLMFEMLVFFVTYGFLVKVLSGIRSHPYDRLFRFIPATLHAIVMYVFFLSLVFSLPVRGEIKAAILNSKSGPMFISYSQKFEQTSREVFGKAILESVNFLSVKQGATESRNIRVDVNETQLIYDTESESIMFRLINEERGKSTRRLVTYDPNLRNVARRYAKEMFRYSFFSHISLVDGSSVSERVTRDGIVFVNIGENLAYAPDVYLAHQGLMNSEGHKANILSEDFGRVGVGVVDAGIWGKMFVQVYTN